MKTYQTFLSSKLNLQEKTLFFSAFYNCEYDIFESRKKRSFFSVSSVYDQFKFKLTKKKFDTFSILKYTK